MVGCFPALPHRACLLGHILVQPFGHNAFSAIWSSCGLQETLALSSSTSTTTHHLFVTQTGRPPPSRDWFLIRRFNGIGGMGPIHKERADWWNLRWCWVDVSSTCRSSSIIFLDFILIFFSIVHHPCLLRVSHCFFCCFCPRGVFFGHFREMED